MDEVAQLTIRQQLLLKVRDVMCAKNSAELARRIGKDPTYVSRLFYPPTKKGAKGVGLEIMDAASNAFGLPAGFWNLQSADVAEQILRTIKSQQDWGLAKHILPATGDEVPYSPNGILLSSDEHQRMGVAEPRTAYGLTPIHAWEHQDELPEGEFVMIPRLDVHLSAGGGREQVEIELTKDNPQAFRAEWIRLMRLKPNKLAAMRASGESMEPTIYDGDSLLVDTSQTNVVDGKVYALWYDGGERVKRLFRLPGGGLRIISDNARFPVIELGPDHHEQVRIIGRIVHRSSVGGL